jgi:hypothetical protein
MQTGQPAMHNPRDFGSGQTPAAQHRSPARVAGRANCRRDRPNREPTGGFGCPTRSRDARATGFGRSPGVHQTSPRSSECGSRGARDRLFERGLLRTNASAVARGSVYGSGRDTGCKTELPGSESLFGAVRNPGQAVGDGTPAVREETLKRNEAQEGAGLRSPATATRDTRPEDGATPRSRRTPSSHPDPRRAGNSATSIEAVVENERHGGNDRGDAERLSRGILRGAGPASRERPDVRPA